MRSHHDLKRTSEYLGAKTRNMSNEVAFPTGTSGKEFWVN